MRQSFHDIVRLGVHVSHVVAIVFGFRLDHRLLKLADEVLQIGAQVLHGGARRESGGEVRISFLGEVVLVELSRRLGTLLDYELLEL